jgi:glycosyltransferase involved in cell wall biosynthesis
MQNDHRTVLVAIREYGLPHEPWMRRQIAGMSSLDVRIMCWKRANILQQPIPESAIHTLQAEVAPYDGKKRWVYRLANAVNGNFYAALGTERQEIHKLIREQNPSSILCYDGDIALRLGNVAREAQIPLIAYFHGDFRFLRNRWYRWSLQRTAPKFAAVVVVTEQERVWMRENGVPDRILHVIPCGAPTSVFTPKSESRHGKIRFVMASRLADDKGCKESILAFERVAARRNDVFLHVYGDGPERRNLESLAKARGLGDLIKFHGYVDAQAMPAELRECHVFIQHSLRREGSPVSIVEAMSCGLPVVATAVGGIVDQIVHGSTGYIVAENDIEAMAHAMLRLAEDATQRKAFGQNGRKRATELFDSSLLTARLEQLVVDVSTRRTASTRFAIAQPA